jgi:hypothetical protein
MYHLLAIFLADIQLLIPPTLTGFIRVSEGVTAFKCCLIQDQQD